MVDLMALEEKLDVFAAVSSQCHNRKFTKS